MPQPIPPTPVGEAMVDAPPIAVVIEGPTPVPVVLVTESGDPAAPPGSRRAVDKGVTPGQIVPSTSKPDVMTTPGGQLVAAPTTTEEEERTSAGQRQTSLLWETTQAKIALAVVYVALITAAVLSLAGILPWATEKQAAMANTSFMLLSSLSSLVIGFYYGRTNHQKVGGVGQVSGR